MTAQELYEKLSDLKRQAADLRDETLDKRIEDAMSALLSQGGKRMKFLYVWDDWSLFHVEEVEVLATDVHDERYPGTFTLIKSGSKSTLVSAKQLFDTYEEAYQYGLTNVPKGIS